MKKKKKITKKRVIIAIVLLLIIGSIVMNKLKPSEDDNKKIEVTEITKRNIAKSISDTGVVKTNTSKEFISKLSGSKILTVNVKEGDQVNPGDVICTFDTTEIQRSLNTALKTAGIADAQAQIGINGAARNYNDAMSNKDTQVRTTQSDVDAAKKAFDESTDKLNALRQAVQNMEPQAKEMQTKIPALEKAYKDAEAAYTFAQSNASVHTVQAQTTPVTGETSTADNTTGGETTSPVPANSSTGISAAELADLYSKYIAAKNAYDSANSVISSYNGLVAQRTEMESASSQLLTAYEKAVQGLDTVSKTSDSTVAASYDALLNSELAKQSTNVSAQSQIATLRDQLKEGTLISDVSGTITKVNFKPGDMYTGTTIAILDGCEDIVIESEIGEYDIPDVKVGMKVMVKTDATRDEELEGRVTYVSPVSSSMINSSAMASMASSSSSNATYLVKISLDKGNERLRLGMNAKLSIITEMKENVWTVPYECIMTKDDGSFYIEVADNDEGTEKHELAVQKGIEGTYYTEIISSELKDGMKVIVPEVEAANSLENLIEMMGPSAGM